MINARFSYWYSIKKIKCRLFGLLRKSLPVDSVDTIRRFLFSSRNIVFSIIDERVISVKEVTYRDLFNVNLSPTKSPGKKKITLNFF